MYTALQTAMRHQHPRTITCFLLLLFLIGSAAGVQAQLRCGTKAKTRTTFPQLPPFQASKTSTPTTLPIALHLFLDSAGAGNGLTTSLFQETLDSGNVYFNQINLDAQLCHLNVMMDNQTVNPTMAVLSDIIDSLVVPGMINVFVPNSVQGTTWGGVSSLIGGPYDSTDHVLVIGQEYYHGVTIHEIGHFLGLYHTHESMFGWEMVNGNNCQTAGDLICDTPADPGMAWTDVDSMNCTWANSGNAVDQNGDLYAPSGENFMSYSILTCLKEFSPTQLQVMRANFDTYISFFDTLCGAPVALLPPSPAPAFSIFPNPSAGRVRIAIEEAAPFDGEFLEIRVTGADGKTHFFGGGPGANGIFELDLGGLPAGLYVVDLPGFPGWGAKRLVHQPQ